MKRLALFAIPLFLCATPMLLFAQQLVPIGSAESGSTDWKAIALGVLALTVAGVVGYLVWRHKHPAAAVTVEGDLTKAAAIVGTEFGKLRDTLEKVVAKAAPAGPEAAAPPAAPPVIAGKSGTAGTFSAPVTGDPKVDIPALTAAYYS